MASFHTERGSSQEYAKDDQTSTYNETWKNEWGELRNKWRDPMKICYDAINWLLLWMTDLWLSDHTQAIIDISWLKSDESTKAALPYSAAPSTRSKIAVQSWSNGSEQRQDKLMMKWMTNRGHTVKERRRNKIKTIYIIVEHANSNATMERAVINHKRKQMNGWVGARIWIVQAFLPVNPCQGGSSIKARSVSYCLITTPRHV